MGGQPLSNWCSLAWKKALTLLFQMKYWLFDRITSCVSAEGKRPREGADLGYGVSSSHGGLLLRDSLTGSQAPLSTHLLPPFYHQVFALAWNPAPEPAQFKARFSVKPFRFPVFSPSFAQSGSNEIMGLTSLFTVFLAAPLVPGTPPASLPSRLSSSELTSGSEGDCVPGSIPSAWHVLTHLILTLIPWGQYYYYLQFPNEKTETRGH